MAPESRGQTDRTPGPSSEELRRWRGKEGAMGARKFVWLAFLAVLVPSILAAGQQAASQAVQPENTAAARTAVVNADAAVAGVTESLPAAVNPSGPRKLMLKEGMPVKLRTVKDISSKTCTTGDAVDMVLDQDVKVGDMIVVPKGALALATVSNAKKAGAFGRGGELNLRLEYLKAGDTKLRLRGAQAEQGKGKEGAVVALTVAFGPVGFLKHGKQAEVKAGTPIDAIVDQDTELTLN